MKAMILAAGRGERMRPLTDETPKPLLRAGRNRLIEYHIENLAKAGYRDIVINVAWLGEKIVQTIGDGSRYGVSIAYSIEKEALETAGGIVNARHLLGTEPFVVVNGDVYTEYDFSSLREKLQGLAYLVLVNNPQHNLKGDFALQGERVMSDGERKFTFSGIACYHPDLFKDCKPGKAPLAPLLRAAMSNSQVRGELYSGEWRDIGTVERLSELDSWLVSR